MAFRVWMTQAVARAEGVDQRRHVGTMACEQRDIVAERFAEAARLDEIALHVDDDQRGVRGSKVNGERLAAMSAISAASDGSESRCASPMAGRP